MAITRIAIFTMENINKTRKLEQESLPGLVGTFTKAIISMMKGTEMDRCSGPMEVCTKENGPEEYNMV
jgi:hypothetical protein